MFPQLSKILPEEGEIKFPLLPKASNFLESLIHLKPEEIRIVSRFWIPDPISCSKNVDNDAFVWNDNSSLNWGRQRLLFVPQLLFVKMKLSLG